MLESELIDNPSNEIVWAFGGIEYSVTFGGSFTQYIAELGEYNFNVYRRSFWRAAYIKQAHGKCLWLGKLIHFVLYTNFLNGLLFYKKNYLTF